MTRPPLDSSGVDDRSYWRGLLWIAALVVVGALARLEGSEAVLGRHVHLIDPDSHYHARRMLEAARAFPALPPRVDPMLDFPHGYAVSWPPGLDYLGGTVLRARGASSPEAASLVGIGLVLLLGLATLPVVFALSRRIGLPRSWAALATLLVAAAPMHIEYTRVGRIDHHVLEPLLVALFVLLYLRARRRGAPPGAVAACGVTLGGCFWSWPTALLDVSLLAGGMLAAQWLGRRQRSQARLTSGALWIAVSLLLPLAALRAETIGWGLSGPSLAHLTLLAAVALISSWLALAARVERRWELGPRAAAAIALGGGAVVVALAIGATPIRQHLALLWAFGARRGLWGLILEQRPLLALPWAHVVLLVTYFGFVAPLLLVVSLRGASLEHRLLVGWAALFTAAGLAQIRFLPAAVVISSPLCVRGLRQLIDLLTQRVRGARPRARGRWVGPALVGAALLSLWPALSYLFEALHLPGARQRALERTVRWLSDPGGRRDGATRPAVMASLGLGHALVHLAGRPVVGSAIVEPATTAANRDAIAFFTAIRQQRALSIAVRRRVGWVVRTRLPPGRYLRLLRQLRPTTTRRYAFETFRRALATRLLADFGSGAREGSLRLAAIPWLQHRWEGPLLGLRRTADVYRIVRGARVVGRARPRSLVALRIALQTNRRRTLIYRDERRADGQGRFSLTVPYDTEPRPGQTAAIAPARLSGAQRTLELSIPRRAVDTGGEIRVELL